MKHTRTLTVTEVWTEHDDPQPEATCPAFSSIDNPPMEVQGLPGPSIDTRRPPPKSSIILIKNFIVYNTNIRKIKIQQRGIPPYIKKIQIQPRLGLQGSWIKTPLNHHPKTLK